MGKKKDQLIVMKYTLTVVLKKDPNMSLEEQKKELETNLRAVIDRGFDNGDITQDTDCEVVDAKETFSFE